MDYKKQLHERLDARKEKLISFIDRLHRMVDAGQLGGESGRIWLDQYAIGVGVNLCCGDFSVGNSLGIDNDPEKIAIDIWGLADHYYNDMPPLDFVVTNYLECFPDPLGVLKNWNKKLKPGGIFAVVACNTDMYANPAGPLANPRRLNCFSTLTLKAYFQAAGFKVEKVDLEDKELRIMGRKV